MANNSFQLDFSSAEKEILNLILNVAVDIATGLPVFYHGKEVVDVEFEDVTPQLNYGQKI